MLFNSLEFILFFVLVTILYFLFPSKKHKNGLLLFASYYFYMSWNPKYVVLLLFSTAITFVTGLMIEKASTERERKIPVVVCIVLNLGLLFFFKYYNFAFETISRILEMISIELPDSKLDVVLPVGISFYTFQALGYIVDVYRKDIAPEKNFFRYALFVSFFPQLVAGPIERSNNLLSELDKERSFDIEALFDGILIMVYGFFLKIVLADRLAVLVDTVYNEPSAFSGIQVVIATIFFAVQIYCDFYGYSTIALGAARILGIQLMENFNAPYFSRSVSEFWKRWHISLSSWFRDYLYIPLGGNRKGEKRTLINLLIVFAISGLWHGAQWSFVAWGLINGLAQVFSILTKKYRDSIVTNLKIDRNSISHTIFQTLVTFCIITFSWIFFRAERLGTAFSICTQIVTNLQFTTILDANNIFNMGLGLSDLIVVLLSIIILMISDYSKKKGIRILERFKEKNVWFQGIMIAFAVVVILVFGIYGPAFHEASFIYFQF